MFFSFLPSLLSVISKASRVDLNSLFPSREENQSKGQTERGNQNGAERDDGERESRLINIGFELPSAHSSSGGSERDIDRRTGDPHTIDICAASERERERVELGNGVAGTDEEREGG